LSEERGHTVQVSHHHHPNKRDRISTVLDAPGDGRYVAYFIDITYKKVGDHKTSVQNFIPRDLSGRLEFTTQVSIFPNTFPYTDCAGAACGNGLI